MQDWEKRLNSFIEMFEYGLLQDTGKVTAEIAKLHAETHTLTTAIQVIVTYKLGKVISWKQID